MRKPVVEHLDLYADGQRLWKRAEILKLLKKYLFFLEELLVELEELLQHLFAIYKVESGLNFPSPRLLTLHQNISAAHKELLSEVYHFDDLLVVILKLQHHWTESRIERLFGAREELDAHFAAS